MGNCFLVPFFPQAPQQNGTRNNHFREILGLVILLQTCSSCGQRTKSILLTFKSFLVTNYAGRDLFLRKLTNIFLFYFANSNINSVSPVLAGHTIKGKDFREKYLSKLFDTPQIVGVFLQNKVSNDTDHHIISFTHTQCLTLTGSLICPLGNQFLFLVAH